MLVEDKVLLEQLVQEYPIEDVINALHQIVSDRADQLSDAFIMDQSKTLSKIAWHLQSIADGDIISPISDI